MFIMFYDTFEKLCRAHMEHELIQTLRSFPVKEKGMAIRCLSFLCIFALQACSSPLCDPDYSQCYKCSTDYYSNNNAGHFFTPSPP